MEEKTDIKPAKTVGRRQFLGYLGAVGGALITGTGLKIGKELSQIEERKKEIDQAVAQRKASNILKKLSEKERSVVKEKTVRSELTAQATIIGDDNEWQIPPKEEVKRLDEKIKDYVNTSPLFTNCPKDEKQTMVGLIRTQFESLNNETTKQIAINNLKYWQNTLSVDHIADLLKVKKNSYLRKLIYPLIYVESRGQASPENDDKTGDFGLCQIKQTTAAGVINRLKETGFNHVISILKFKDKNTPDLNDPKTNLILALEYLVRLYEVYHDFGLAIWAYNLGMKNIEKAIDEYNSAKPNIIGLITSAKVKNELKTAGVEETTFSYVPSIAAAEILLSEAKVI